MAYEIRPMETDPVTFIQSPKGPLYFSLKLLLQSSAGSAQDFPSEIG